MRLLSIVVQQTYVLFYEKMMQAPTQQIWIQFRAHSAAREFLPLSVRSVGRYRVNAQWQETTGTKWFLQLFWIFEGSGRFHNSGGTVDAGCGDIFIYSPGSQHTMESTSERWGYCWLTLDHPESVRWLQGFGLGHGLQKAGHCPEGRFRSIGQSLADGTVEGECRAAQEAHALFIEASKNREQPNHSRVVQAKAAMDASFNNPAFTIQTLADELSVHRSTLFRIFRAQYGLTPIQYLKNLRLHQALRRIQQSNDPLHVIASESGFSDPSYLSRLIKQTVGLSAQKLRMSRPNDL
ncbi:MAG: AraC family transcriptional regulator [Puniceicoccaceae bacterium]|nr:MAG: AraC family transcriptional regulator [Puniceicoccaceae bacterium]